MTTEAELRQSLSSRGRIKNIYLLVGDDPYLVKTYAEKIGKITAGDNADLNLVSLPEGAEVQDMYDSLMQFSFTGDSICVLCSNFPFDTCGNNEFKKLLSLIENAPENNVLVLYYDVMSVDVKKSNNFQKLSAAVEKAGGMVCALNHKTESELVKILCDGAAKRFIKLDASIARYMIAVCSNDLNILVNELEKLAAFVGKEGIVTKETVDKICPKTLEATVYDLSRFIINKQGDKALCLLNDLLKQGNAPVKIYSLIVETYVDIFRAKAAQSAGIRPENIASKFGYGNRAFVLSNAAMSAKRLSDNQISQILRELLLTDALVKNDVKIVGDGAKTALETLIIKIIHISSGEQNA